MFINGCFWHQHNGCKNAALPATNTEFWREKLTATVMRDKNNSANLTGMGWSVFIIWECEIERDIELSLTKLLAEVNG